MRDPRVKREHMTGRIIEKTLEMPYEESAGY